MTMSAGISTARCLSRSSGGGGLHRAILRRVLCAVAAGATGLPCAAAPASGIEHAAVEAARLATELCAAVEAGDKILPFVGQPGSERALEKLGLAAAISGARAAALGPYWNMTVGPRLGFKELDAGVIIVSTDGLVPGCKVDLAADPDTSLGDRVAAALTAPKRGWRPLPEWRPIETGMSEAAFYRRDGSSVPYLLTVSSYDNPAGRVQISLRVRVNPPLHLVPNGIPES